MGPEANSFEGFAFSPEIRRHHMVVDLPTRLAEDVVVTEDVSDRETPREKARIPLRYWREIQQPVSAEFNRRIRESEDLKNCRRGAFTRGRSVPIDLLLGRELLVLLWAVEPWDSVAETDPIFLYIPRALETWLGMSPEERWTLYRLTNAQAGHAADRGKGWRRSLRYGLCGEISEAHAPEPPPRRSGRPTAKKKARTRPSPNSSPRNQASPTSSNPEP